MGRKGKTAFCLVVVLVCCVELGRYFWGGPRLLVLIEEFATTVEQADILADEGTKAVQEGDCKRAQEHYREAKALLEGPLREFLGYSGDFKRLSLDPRVVDGLAVLAACYDGLGTVHRPAAMVLFKVGQRQYWNQTQL